MKPTTDDSDMASTADNQRSTDSDNSEAIIACGGATQGTHMRLHSSEDCAALANAVEIRPATDGEIDSREWCEMCVGGTAREDPNWSIYRAAVEAGQDD